MLEKYFLEIFGIILNNADHMKIIFKIIILHLIPAMVFTDYELFKFNKPAFKKNKLASGSLKQPTTLPPEVFTYLNPIEDTKIKNFLEKEKAEDNTKLELQEELIGKDSQSDAVDFMESSEVKFESVSDINDYIKLDLASTISSAPFVRIDPRWIKQSNKRRYSFRAYDYIKSFSMKKEKKNMGTDTLIYILQSPFSTKSGFEIKVGESTNIDSRMKTYRFYWRKYFKAIAQFKGTVSDERYIQNLLSPYHISGEYYDLSLVQIDAIKNMKTLYDFESYFFHPPRG